MTLPIRQLLIVVLAGVLWVASGCSTRFSDPAAGSGPMAGPVAPTTQSGPVAPAAPIRPAQRVLPTLDREPLVRVFLAQGTQLDLSLMAAGTAEGRSITTGAHRVQAAGGQILLDGVALPAECRLNLAAADVRFAAELEPPFGKRQRLSFSGQPVLRLQGGQVQLLEEVPLETYLAGVIPIEMTPSWPVEALKAQAIAARSYAAAKYLERFDRPWQLHWHYSVDMAYAGASAKSSAAVRQALRETRGALLSYHGLPLPALFHACSGGATEAATNLWPTLAGADRKTPMAAQMPVVQDPAAEAGCTGLGFTRSHWRWKANLSLAEITSDLQAWARTHPEDKLAFGTVTGIEIASRHPDSGRVALVAISHKLDGRTRRTMLPAADFRMAVDPGLCRSTWWDRCLVVPGKGGTLVLAGRGFGHGAGLSQVSAWQLARTGNQADAIVRRFYPQAALERRW